MKLDLLYEIDVPEPWADKPHPYGQREREQRAYREVLEQIKLADKVGFPHDVARRAPLPRGAVALPGTGGADRRADARSPRTSAWGSA